MGGGSNAENRRRKEVGCRYLRKRKLSMTEGEKVGLVTDGGHDIKGFGKQKKSPVPGSQECYPRVTTALGLLRKTIRV